MVVAGVHKKPRSDKEAHPDGRFCEPLCFGCGKPLSDKTAHPDGKYCPDPRPCVKCGKKKAEHTESSDHAFQAKAGNGKGPSGGGRNFSQNNAKGKGKGKART